ncbi:MAG: hypothetical protein ACM31C_23755 [Acidobacteriota bacterium]
MVLALAACGDDKAKPDAFSHIDSPMIDALNIPPAPTPGAQIDRMGRPAVNTALNHVFDTDMTAEGSAKDAYNADGGAGTWQTTYLNEFAKNLAILDALDTTLTATGCKNQVGYNGNAGGGGSAMACPGATCSYNFMSGVLADDELYLDTAKTTCKFYLAVEFGVVSGLGNDTCGGRAPDYDVIDFSYTALAVGIAGFSTDGNYVPAFGDGVPAHTDTLGTCSTTTTTTCAGENDKTSCPTGETCVPQFPFLGPPHNM